MPNWDNDEDFDPSWENHESQIERQRRRLYGTRVQETKLWNGKPVRDMETDHIMNALLFCEKRFAESQQNHRVCFAGEESFYFDSPYEMFPDYKNLREEWAKRNKS